MPHEGGGGGRIPRDLEGGQAGLPFWLPPASLPSLPSLFVWHVSVPVCQLPAYMLCTLFLPAMTAYLSMCLPAIQIILCASHICLISLSLTSLSPFPIPSFQIDGGWRRRRGRQPATTCHLPPAACHAAAPPRAFAA